MPGFTTTEDGSWSFTFSDEPSKPSLPDGPTMATGYLEGPGKWDNYSDNVLYETEYLMRSFFDSKSSDPKWRQTNPKYRRYTCGMMFEVLHGRKPDMNSRADQDVIRRLVKLMTYYSTRRQKEGSILGKKVSHTIYTLSLRRYANLKPYSLKLRAEWLAERGEVPCWQNMRLPKDDLEIGHSRNPRTDENMARRRERAKARYNERYRDRNR